MTSNWGYIKCHGWCEKMKLKVGEYSLKTDMFFIVMGGCDIVLSVEWLTTSNPVAMDFLELYTSFRRMEIPRLSKVSRKTLQK
jgi:hypothetical protein